MSLHLIIDGYNLIRRSPSLSALDRQDLETGRAELIQRLATYRKLRPVPITVIFDGWNQMSLSESRTTERGIRVVFSKRGQKADELVIASARDMGEKAVVVTSDRQVQLEAQRHHATVISSEEFEIKMEMATYAVQKGIASEDPSDRTETEGTRKKGPSRRLPKAVRKAKRRIAKL
jgi:predicted RNA-binding protein with PIN domain